MNTIVESGATRSTENDTCQLFTPASASSTGVDLYSGGSRGALFVGETYALEVPVSATLKQAKIEFVVTSVEQLVEIRWSGALAGCMSSCTRARIPNTCHYLSMSL